MSTHAALVYGYLRKLKLGAAAAALAGAVSMRESDLVAAAAQLPALEDVCRGVGPRAGGGTKRAAPDPSDSDSSESSSSGAGAAPLTKKPRVGAGATRCGVTVRVIAIAVAFVASTCALQMCQCSLRRRQRPCNGSRWRRVRQPRKWQLW